MAPPPPDREDPVISNAQRRNEDCEVTSKDKEISSLMESIQRLQSSLNHLRESSASQIRLLEEQLDQKQEIISRLEARLDSQRDYEEIQRELIILKGHTGTEPSSVTVNGFDTKDSKDKRTGSPACSLTPRFMLDHHPSLPVDTIGSMLSEELAANWRRSLERSLLSTSPPSHHVPNPGNTPLHHGNDSSSPLPQHSPPGDTNMNDSSGNVDNVSLLNGNMSGSNERLPFRFEDSLIPKSDPMEARLQEMLRYNMDKFGSQCLDTLQIARRVRELLSIHNIGQRLFAKYVLGLSQGTVSELLSKPKPWDKLTEKGRDSYRKMHAWAADEASVLLLKSLIPKKGKEGPPGNLPSFRPEESGAEDRIAHILSEANHVLHRNNQFGVGMSYDSVCDDNAGTSDDKSPSSNNNGCNNNGQGPSSPSSSSSRDRRLRKYENDDISQEQLARIYQEQLAKHILTHGVPDAEPRLPTDAFQSMIFPHLFGGSLLETEEIRMLLDAYHRGFSKFAASTSSSPHFRPVVFQSNAATTVNGISSAQDLSLPKRPSPDLNDNDEQVESDDPTDSGRQVVSAFSLVRPKGGETSGGSGAPSPLDSILHPSGDDSSNASPLQRMASITNSLISQPTTPTVSSPNQRPLKAVLPPITQQQFDQYNNLNTEDIVRKVKEQLSQYSISQRLFGESVLGLSQGSVSDLLARPKPWHMLTQKGREPFIRMKMFLEDDNAVHKLVASQYKIAPEKLMRTGGYSGNPSPTSGSKPPPKVIEIPKNIETSPLPIQPTLISPVPILHEVVKKSPISQGRTATSPVLNMRSNPGCLPQQPSVYEMAALTQDLDTQLITTKIKEALLANNIGQKIFGEVVLGLSQGSVSELLSKPKPWHMLSIKGREPFIRMQLWLADPLNIERLQHLKNERREANKRKRGLTHGGTNMDSYASGTQGSSDASNDSPNESYSPGSGSTVPPSKKQRVLFTDEQKEALKLAFSLDSYPNVAAIEFLGRELGLSSRTITNWFHNHRMRLKQQSSNASIQESAVSSQPFDPIQFRLLLHQRLIEMHKYNSLPLFGAHTKNLSDEGLDLTVSNNASRIPSDSEDDDFDDGHEDDGSSDGGDSATSTGSKDLIRKRKSIRKIGLNLACGTPRPIKFCGGTSGSSRRKPVAPQWLNPSWHDDSDDDEVLINGVCVVQNPIHYDKYVKKSLESSTNHPSHKAKLKTKENEIEIKSEESNGKRLEGNRLEGHRLEGHRLEGNGREERKGHREMLKVEVNYRSENECSE